MRSIVRGIVVWVAGHGTEMEQMEHRACVAGYYPHIKAELNENHSHLATKTWKYIL